MNLLFIIPEYPPDSAGGIATYYRHLLNELASQGHQIDVLVGSAFSSKQATYHTDSITVKFLDPTLITDNLCKFNHYHAIPELQRHLAAAWTAWEQMNGGQGYDVVETTDWGMLFAPWIVSSDSPPTVVQLHASIGQIDFYDPQIDTQLQGHLIRLLEIGLLSMADELQANSSSNAQAWHQLTEREITYIPPALCATSHSPSTNQSDTGLVVGRIQYWKGPTVLCEALRLLGDKAPTLDWVGRDTPYRESDTSMSAYLAKTYPDIWGCKIRPLGQKPPQETLQLQANAGFMVVPSIWDVFNYTCVEGMALAQAVLCSEGAGAAGLITNGVDGLTFAANNPQALATSLEIMLSLNQSERQQMRKAAQQTIQTRLTPAQIAQQRIAAYEKLLNRGKFSVRPNSWLVSAVSPQEPMGKPLAFLNRLPLRDLSSYVIERTLKKIINQ